VKQNAGLEAAKQKANQLLGEQTNDSCGTT
jgi:hypothetical protein